MRLKRLSTQNLNWSSTVEELYKSKLSKTAQQLIQTGYHTLEDLLKITPLRILKIPKTNSFKQAGPGLIFKGYGKILDIQKKPSRQGFGKKRIPLSNLTVVVQDHFSPQTLTLKWFNTYPNIYQKLISCETLSFTGEVGLYMGSLQIISPDIKESGSLKDTSLKELQKVDTIALKVQYPTINGISPQHVGGVFKKIPLKLWNNIPETIPEEIVSKRKLMSRSLTFQILHGKSEPSLIDEKNKALATNRLVYEEFFLNQIKIKIKIKSRKDLIQKKKGIIHRFNQKSLSEYSKLFPYQLTKDQKSVLQDIAKDLSCGHPMMRLIQGDVGCGKTTVALISALLSVDNGYQSALMCPTESLATQHFLNFIEILKERTDIKIALLLGSTKKKEKNQILQDLKEGHIHIIIGTHALIQDSVQFKNLSLAIVDEQHKFGVDQRLKLVSKTEGCHCLIMTATPIPRSLSLTQYGDLEISTIRTMPGNRKGTKTRIVTQENFQNFLTFLNTRLNMGEQAYIVVPAIENNEELDLLALEEVLKKFKEIFKDKVVRGLHGKLKPDEKKQTFLDFHLHKFDILVATSVIEVGINILNASVISIMNPERFGLSSLHQLRGRVGRGERPGFCFLVVDKKISNEGMQRLKVIENTTDGFIIAEEDLKMRGEGDIFGTDQSGQSSAKMLTSILLHQDLLQEAREDIDYLYMEKNAFLFDCLHRLSDDKRLTQTI
jgi:ATP-dependent DNA helicase RecG